MVCANGLVAGTNICTPIKIRHSGEGFNDRLILGISHIVEQAEKLASSIEKLKEVKLSESQIETFKREALALRFDADTKIERFSFPINRVEDSSNDVFTVMNVIQESLIRGGAKVLSETNGKRSDRNLRAVNSIQVQTKINVGLWEMAERLAA
jgi:hypothetical protein